ncbi:hypothetical protein OESDEN_06087 [Oesophagostomum dentatum]|uniref:Uncharacterized protein n=1 Tax=Oesophagostomum dentatum TaxID=61180 RepID=A0A0B1TDS8_OESDE|nr:hypothetical protein OESDEN_06087 [Oesophagostomum dentatum]
MPQGLLKQVLAVNSAKAARRMMFPGGVSNSELQQAAADKVKNDVGTFVLFGLLIEAVAYGASYFGIEGVLL